MPPPPLFPSRKTHYCNRYRPPHRDRAIMKRAHLLAGCTVAVLLAVSPAVSAEPSGIRAPRPGECGALQARQRARPAYRLPRRPSQRQQSEQCRLPRALETRLRRALLQHALHQQRHHRGSGDGRARREDRGRLRPHDTGDHEGGPLRPQRRLAADELLPGRGRERRRLLPGPEQAHAVRAPSSPV